MSDRASIDCTSSFSRATTSAGVPLGAANAYHALTSKSGTTVSAWRGMLTYNVLVTLCLLRLGLQGEWAGPLLWPAVGLHAFLSLGLGRRR